MKLQSMFQLPTFSFETPAPAAKTCVSWEESCECIEPKPERRFLIVHLEPARQPSSLLAKRTFKQAFAIDQSAAAKRSKLELIRHKPIVQTRDK